jgi:hypothetical protein
MMGSFPRLSAPTAFADGGAWVAVVVVWEYRARSEIVIEMSGAVAFGIGKHDGGGGMTV